MYVRILSLLSFLRKLAGTAFEHPLEGVADKTGAKEGVSSANDRLSEDLGAQGETSPSLFNPFNQQLSKTKNRFDCIISRHRKNYQELEGQRC